jgi:hypothetical protein
MGTAASPTNRKKKKEDDKKKTLTKVLSTKLSIEDYKDFEYLQITHIGTETSVKIVHQKCYDI